MGCKAPLLVLSALAAVSAACLARHDAFFTSGNPAQLKQVQQQSPTPLPELVTLGDEWGIAGRRDKPDFQQTSPKEKQGLPAPLHLPATHCLSAATPMLPAVARCPHGGALRRCCCSDWCRASAASMAATSGRSIIATCTWWEEPAADVGQHKNAQQATQLKTS